MTLIITTIQRAGIVLTSDGGRWMHGKPVEDTFQKIYPIPNAPLALYQWDHLEIGGWPGGELIQEFIVTRGSRLGRLSVKKAAEAVCAFFHPHMFATARFDGSTRLCLAGFGPCCTFPHVFEMNWDAARDGHVSMIWFTYTAETGMLLAGNASDCLSPYRDDSKLEIAPALSKSRLAGNPVSVGLRLHDELYKKAEHNGTANCKPVGRRHRLIIEASGWRWAEPPST